VCLLSCVRVFVEEREGARSFVRVGLPSCEWEAVCACACVSVCVRMAR